MKIAIILALLALVAGTQYTYNNKSKPVPSEQVVEAP